METGDGTSRPRKSSLVSKLLLARAEAGTSPGVVDIRIKLSDERLRNAKGYPARLGFGNLASCNAYNSAIELYRYRSENDNKTVPERLRSLMTYKHCMVENSDTKKDGTHVGTKLGLTWVAETITVI